MSLKDKGNEEFKKNNLEKAIEYYSRYVEQDNNDNELAFTNMAMCYFKLKNYQKTIEACESALKEKKELPKAYYRLYLTYKEMPNEEYQAFLNSYLFLKYFNEESPSSKAEAFKIMR
jgi:tetratricopeptide (TPR) repeat protein